MLYKVVFDTQAVWSREDADLREIFSDSIPNIRKFLKEHSVQNVQLCVAEMVVRERIQQKEESIEDLIKKFGNILERLKDLGYKVQLKPPRVKTKTALAKVARDILVKNSVEIIKTPKLKAESLLDRAVEKRKPFNRKGAGLKDTIIFLSMVEDAKKERSKDVSYILVSGNSKDFTKEVEEEFKKKTSKTMQVVADIDSLKELLDKVIPLGLELKLLHNEIRESIMKRGGTIMENLNKTLIDRSHRNSRLSFGTSDVYHHSVFADPLFGTRDEKEIIGYDFEGINIEDISDIGNDIFRVQGVLMVNPKYKQKEDTTYGFMDAVGITTSRPKLFRFDIIYNKSSEVIQNVSFGGGYMFF